MPEFSYIKSFRCVTCGREYPIDKTIYTCPECGPLKGTIDVLYDINSLEAHFSPETIKTRADPTMWRYHELLPVTDPDSIVQIPVGMTPLYRLDCDPGFESPEKLFVKDDTRHPSGSAKDRATAVAMARARESGVTAVAAASTGNAASSLAMFAARAGFECFIFVPATAPPAKLTQIQAHGATLFVVDGNYDQAFDLCTDVCDHFGFLSRNTAVNPFLGEGKKTIALEIWEQLGFREPDVVIVPVGDGCIVGGVYKGFHDLFELQLIKRLPRLVGVQASGSSALFNAWRDGAGHCEPVDAVTVADSLSVSNPRDQIKALRAIRESDGFFVSVEDEAILKAMSALATRAGIFAEPAAAASLAGLKSAMESGQISRGEEVVLLLTGHGLKDIHSAGKASSWNQPINISPDLEEVRRALKRRA